MACCHPSFPVSSLGVLLWSIALRSVSIGSVVGIMASIWSVGNGQDQLCHWKCVITLEQSKDLRIPFQRICHTKCFSVLRLPEVTIVVASAFPVLMLTTGQEVSRE